MVILVIIIAVLAGLLGAVASGGIKTSATPSTDLPATTTSESSAGPTSTPTPSTQIVLSDSGPVTVECPSADGLNYTAETSGGQKVFMRSCYRNYETTEGSLIRHKTILSMTDCLDECANSAKCIGVVFNARPQCHLKYNIGLKVVDAGSETALLWQ